MIINSDSYRQKKKKKNKPYGYPNSEVPFNPIT